MNGLGEYMLLSIDQRTCLIPDTYIYSLIITMVDLQGLGIKINWSNILEMEYELYHHSSEPLSFASSSLRMDAIVAANIEENETVSGV